jgi:hypothetical protein
MCGALAGAIMDTAGAVHEIRVPPTLIAMLTMSEPPQILSFISGAAIVIATHRRATAHVC